MGDIYFWREREKIFSEYKLALTILSHDLISLENETSAFSKLKIKSKKKFISYFLNLSLDVCLQIVWFFHQWLRHREH